MTGNTISTTNTAAEPDMPAPAKTAAVSQQCRSSRLPSLHSLPPSKTPPLFFYYPVSDVRMGSN